MDSPCKTWASGRGAYYLERLRLEAAELSGRYLPPGTLTDWKQQAVGLRLKLRRQMGIADLSGSRPEITEHGQIKCEGYHIRKISFESLPGVRITGNLYIPDGGGPFPAVLSPHGHFSQGKIAYNVQARGHILARRGFVVLITDAPGSGERGEGRGEWSYHGCLAGASLISSGCSLLGWQVFDNESAIDLLCSLDNVDSSRIGVTGASGGGNQTMWLAAMDDRVKVAVPVVSAGSFAAYVTRRNCFCETLPGGLLTAEEWQLFGLIAPRPTLILNSLQDQPAFAVPTMIDTWRNAREIYRLYDKGDCIDYRAINLPHGYWPEMAEAMLGWMQRWLQNEGDGRPVSLPQWTPIPEEQLLCFPEGTNWPDSCRYSSSRKVLNGLKQGSSDTGNVRRLAEIIGWRSGSDNRDIDLKTESVLFRPGQLQQSVLRSRRGTLIPLDTAAPEAADYVRILLAPQGKNSEPVKTLWRQALAEGYRVLALDLPGTGELCWETEPLAGNPLHDTTRACLWLGYTLLGEWAEVIAQVVNVVAASGIKHIEVHAMGESGLAALFAKILGDVEFQLAAPDLPGDFEGMVNPPGGSLLYILPGILQWGNMGQLKALGKISE